MRWCPKCGTEYRDDFKVCSDCECELVMFQSQVECRPETEKEPVYQNEALLTSVTNDVQAGSIQSILNSYGIPFT